MFTMGKDRIGVHCILAAAYFLMLPLTIATNEVNASFLKILTVPIGLFFVITMVFYRKEFKINMVHILLALYTVLSILALAVNFNMTSVRMLFGYFLNAGLFICISVVEYNQKELQLLEDIQVLLLIIITAIPLFGEMPDGQRTELVIFGQKSDPNYFVGFFVFPLAVTLKKICESKWRLAYMALMAVSLYVILLSGSRGGLIAVATTVIAFTLIYPKGLTGKLQALVAISVCAVIFWTVVIPYLPENIAARFSVEEVIASKGTYRGDIWYTQGLIGVLSFSALLVAAIGRCIKKRKCVAIALIGMMGLSISLSFNTSTKTFWNLIPYAAFAFASVKKEESDESEKENTDSSIIYSETEISKIKEGDSDEY